MKLEEKCFVYALNPPPAGNAGHHYFSTVDEGNFAACDSVKSHSRKFKYLKNLYSILSSTDTVNHEHP